MKKIKPYAEITKKTPEKSLLGVIQRHAGRNSSGKITIRHRGGGEKRKYRFISDLDRFLGQKGKVLAIEYDPNRTANIALVELDSGDKIYILAPEKLEVGVEIAADEKTPIRVGNRAYIGNLSVGTVVHNIELYPKSGGQLVKSAGASATIVAKEGDYVHLRMPSGEIRKIKKSCFASVGQVSRSYHNKLKIGKAGIVRHRGWRPTVRGKAMYPEAHPHGGGEGNAPVGMKHPKTPWGKPALGYKTRRRKFTDQFIIKDRRDKRR